MCALVFCGVAVTSSYSLQFLWGIINKIRFVSLLARAICLQSRFCDAPTLDHSLRHCAGSLQDTVSQSGTQQRKPESDKVDLPEDALASEVEVALRQVAANFRRISDFNALTCLQLEANKKASLALRKSKSKRKRDDSADQSVSSSAAPSSPSAMVPSSDLSPVTSKEMRPASSPPGLIALEPSTSAVFADPDSKADWRRFTFSSIVIGIVVSYVATRWPQ